MAAEPYTLHDFVTDLRRITAATQEEHTILSHVRPLAQRAAGARTWLTAELYGADADQGFGSHVLHVEPDRTLFVVAVSWLPGRGAPPHDHGTWAVIVGVDGPERNTFWARVDDHSRRGYAELRKGGDTSCEAGDVIVMPSGAIHSVRNETERTTLSFHVYGKHLNDTGRSQYDPEQRTERPFLIKTQ